MTTLAVLSTALLALVSCSGRDKQRTYSTPEDAVQALVKAAKAEDVDELIAIFGPEGRDLIASSDAVTARRNREVFVVAVAERWQLTDQGATEKALVIGNEEWPFPVPLTKDPSGWRFDTAAGREEVLARRIGRNELAVMQICRAYLAAQRLYAQRSHDGQPAGRYALTLRSDPGKQNGLYWPARRREKRSPLGDLVAQAAADGHRPEKAERPSPFHGYYFRILTAQGPAAAGGAKDYLQNGALSGGFALVAWPAEYDVTGVMTFVVNHDGVLHQKDLGLETDRMARAMAAYDPDATWEPAR